MVKGLGAIAFLVLFITKPDQLQSSLMSFTQAQGLVQPGLPRSLDTTMKYFFIRDCLSLLFVRSEPQHRLSNSVQELHKCLE